MLLKDLENHVAPKEVGDRVVSNTRHYAQKRNRFTVATLDDEQVALFAADFYGDISYFVAICSEAEAKAKIIEDGVY